MANETQSPPDMRVEQPEPALEPGLATTLKAVIDDALELMKQQLAMLKAEVRADFRQMLAGLIPLACAIGPLLLGVVLAAFALVYLIHWATAPAGYDPAAIPLWASYAIIAAACFLIGGILLGIGVFKLKTVNPLPDQTAQAFEENLQWLMNKTPK